MSTLIPHTPSTIANALVATVRERRALESREDLYRVEILAYIDGDRELLPPVDGASWRYSPPREPALAPDGAAALRALEGARLRCLELASMVGLGSHVRAQLVALAGSCAPPTRFDSGRAESIAVVLR